MILNKDAELTGSDILLKNKKKGPDIGSASTNSISPKSDLSTPFEENSVTKYDIGDYAAKDSEYLSAVERGDMETAQKMVDEAAKAVGYTTKGFHGTPKGDFTVFGGQKTRNGAPPADCQ